MIKRRTLLLLFLACKTPSVGSSPKWVASDELNARLPSSVRAFTLEDDRMRLRAWYVRADLSHPDLSARVVLADDEDRRETVSSLAEQSGACVAVNASYFTRSTEVGNPDGLLRVADKLVAPSDDRNPALGFDSNGRPDIAWVCTLDDAVVELPHTPVKPGDPVRPPKRAPGAEWPMTELVQGRPALIFDGVPLRHDKEVRHPRTAAGIDADGHLILMVVDGRQRKSRGVTFGELTTLMHEVGCVEALNLDGGGSSTLVVGGELVNRPSGRSKQREVLSAIALVAAEDE